MRDTIWRYIRTTFLPNLAVGERLPRWAIAVRVLLYPLKALHWHLSRNIGYQPESDTWLIEGVRYSGEGLRALSKATDQTFRVTRHGNVLTFERIHEID